MSQVVIAGRTFEVRPVNLKALKVVGNRFHFLDNVMSPEGLDVLHDVLFFGIQRSEPTITRDWIEAELEMADIPAALEAIREANGFDKRSVEPGEAQPGQ